MPTSANDLNTSAHIPMNRLDHMAPDLTGREAANGSLPAAERKDMEELGCGYVNRKNYLCSKSYAEYVGKIQ